MLALLVAVLAGDQPAKTPQPPNIVFLLADDLGYGDLGCFGQTIIRTPNLDRLATEGVKLTRHYAGNPVCATSRCVLMTGRHPGHAFIRDNLKWEPEGQYPIPDETVTLAEVLSDTGYVCGGFGKWGLGGPDTEGQPNVQGFDRFFGYNCQRIAHSFYPAYLRVDGQRFPLDNPPVPGHAKLRPDEDPDDVASYERFTGDDYAPDLISAQARAFIRQSAGRPFLMYYPTTVPHLALHVPDDSLAEYTDVITDDPPYPGGKGYTPHRRPRAAYAAMITRMDAEIGRILGLLEELGLTDNTIVVFSSDNGPTYDRLGGSDSEFFDSAGGLRGLKGSMYEGGVRVPTIVRWPGLTQAGAESDALSGFEDWMPTLAAAAGADPTPGDGIDLRPVLRGDDETGRDFLYREFPGYGGFQAVWSGPWKAIRTDVTRKRTASKPLRTELYDLSADRAETTDVASDHPDVLTRLEAIMAREHAPSVLFPMPKLDADSASAKSSE